MKFKSKIAWWFHLTVLFVFLMSALPFVIGIRYGMNSTVVITGTIMLIADILLVLPIYFFTFYTFEDEALHIRCGLFMNKRIAYKDIKTIYETRDPSASAGLSLDRISINYSEGEYLISPKGKQEFIKQLKQRML